MAEVQTWARWVLSTLVGLVATSAVSEASVTPTATSIFVYDSSLSSRFRGQSLAAGDVIRAYDPQGVLCGEYTVAVTDEFSMVVYGNDTETTVDEGASAGEAIAFTINHVAAVVYGGPVVFADQAQFDIRLEVPPPVLGFATTPVSAISGAPITAAVTCLTNGVVDTTFGGAVTLSLASGGGVLAGERVRTAVRGVATFVNVVYRATADGQAFTLEATSPGASAATSAAIWADVVATRLRFSREPAGAANGASLATQPVIEAVDSAGVVDTGYAQPVLVGSVVVTGGGTLSGTLQTVPVAGTATYSDLRYDVAHSGDTFRLTASSGALAPTTSALVAGTIPVRNTAPVADAGPDQTVQVGVLVHLDGRASSDADGDSLRYQWTGPAGVTLNGADTVQPAFSSGPAARVYSLVLVVTDGLLVSAPDTVRVTVGAALEPGWSVPLTVTGSDSEAVALRFGQVAGATDGLDPLLGETEVPPAAPAPRFDARWLVGTSYGAWNDYRSTAPVSSTLVWTLAIRAGDTPGLVAVAWDRAGLPAEGRFVLRGVVNGEAVNADLRGQSELQLTASGAVDLRVEYTAAGSVDVGLNLRRGWNMVSLPGQAGYGALAAAFPTALSLFGFNLGYEQRTALAPGEGYWVNLPAAATVTLAGPTWPDSALVRRVPAHWSMIGVGATPLSVAALKTAYPAVVSVFRDSLGYQLATTLAPGEGYWINLATATVLDLSGRVAPAGKGLAATPRAHGASLLSVLGLAGSQPIELDVPVDQIVELPPFPPESRFDVRADLGAGTWSRQVPAVDGVYPLRLQGGVRSLVWNLPADSPWRLQMGTTSVALSGSGQLAVVDGAPVVLQRVSLPSETMLKDCYPNPFNPSTTVRYHLAQDSDVALSVYGVTGQLVRRLVAGNQVAGAHQANWDGCDAAGAPVGNGVYLAVLQAGGARAVKRMALVK